MDARINSGKKESNAEIACEGVVSVFYLDDDKEDKWQ